MQQYITSALLAFIVVPCALAYVLSSRSDRPRRTMIGLSLLFATIALLIAIAMFLSCHLLGYVFVKAPMTVKACRLFPQLSSF